MRASLKSSGSQEKIQLQTQEKIGQSDMNDLIGYFINYVKPRSIYYSYHVYVLVPADISSFAGGQCKYSLWDQRWGADGWTCEAQLCSKRSMVLMGLLPDRTAHNCKQKARPAVHSNESVHPFFCCVTEPDFTDKFYSNFCTRFGSVIMRVSRCFFGFA